MNVITMADSEADKVSQSLVDTLRDEDPRLKDLPEDQQLNLLPPKITGLPEPNIFLVSAEEKAVGVGNRIANELRGPLPVFALKGRRLDALVRFQFWASTPDAVETLSQELQLRVRNKREQLRRLGFLRLRVENTSPAEHAASLNAWRQSVTYQVLYEYQFRDHDGAESLLARIPIDFVGEFNESTVVTDDLARWDADAAPMLEVRRRGRRLAQVHSLVIFAFLPDGFDGDAVTISVTLDGVARQKNYASLRAFRDAFDIGVKPEDEKPERPLARLGGNPYLVGRMTFPNADFPDPISFASGQDVMQVSYAAQSLPSGNEGVIYLRAT